MAAKLYKCKCKCGDQAILETRNAIEAFWEIHDAHGGYTVTLAE